MAHDASPGACVNVARAKYGPNPVGVLNWRASARSGKDEIEVGDHGNVFEGLPGEVILPRDLRAKGLRAPGCKSGDRSPHSKRFAIVQIRPAFGCIVVRSRAVERKLTMPDRVPSDGWGRRPAHVCEFKTARFGPPHVVPYEICSPSHSKHWNAWLAARLS
jgi:hypothetical protein